MPPTLRSLVSDLRLAVLAGACELDRVVSWVHGTELVDPTPFLEGGELLLTTGLAVCGEYDEYVARLVDVGAAGLGFGTGLSHAVVPPGLVAAAEEARLPLLEVPRATPFIALSKAVSRAVAADEYAALTRTSDAQRALTRAAVGPDGLAAVVRRLGQWVTVGGADNQTRAWVVLLDAAGERTHSFGTRKLPELAAELVRLRASGGLASAAFELDGEHIAMQVLGGRNRGFLVVGRARPLDSTDRGIVNTAASLLTLALAQNDAVDAARRELRSGQFRLLLAGRADLVDGLPAEPFRVFLVDEAPQSGFWADVDGRLVVLAAELDRFDAASSLVDGGSVARGYREATQAAEAGVRWFEDFAGRGLPVPEGFAEALLGPLSPELRETLRVWLAHHGQWDPAAARLGVHRHTLRNRVRKAEELLGRSLDSPGLRAELWLALGQL